jgi:transposase
MDLHSNNVMIGLVNTDGQRLGHKKVPCNLNRVLEVLRPYQGQLDVVAVESTFNWYWLVDGLEENGYRVALANPAGMMPYEGLKHADDKNDAYFLAELARLDILPTGHIYDRQLRPVRDLLRRRMSLVQQRTALLLSLKSLHIRLTGENLSRSQVAALTVEEARKRFGDPASQLTAIEQIQLAGFYGEAIGRIEEAVLKAARPLPSYRSVTQLPGVGVILGLTITMETGPIERFASAGHYASYCRCVKAGRYSNGKSKGANNAKCGNKYLAWAFVEAAQFARRYSPSCRRYYDRKEARTNAAVATKALACKLSKAAWHLMRHQEPLDLRRMFPGEQEPEQSVATPAPTPTSLAPSGSVS